MPHSWKYSTFHVDVMVKLAMNREGIQDSAFCYVLEGEMKFFWTVFSWLQYTAVSRNKRDSIALQAVPQNSQNRQLGAYLCL